MESSCFNFPTAQFGIFTFYFQIPSWRCEPGEQQDINHHTGIHPSHETLCALTLD